MSTASSDDYNRRAPQIAFDTQALSDEPDGPGLYLTNEVFLYRVVSVAGSDMGDMVRLEDCYALDVVQVPMRDFRAGRLRVVTAVPGED